MERLSPLDTAFLDMEDGDRHASLAIASVAVVEGPPPDQQDFVDMVRCRLPLVPRYRQKVCRLPLDLGPPVWVDDPDFELGYHIRRTALPAPGDDAALCRLIGRLMSQRLDRDRPLWECWVIEGLAGGRWAVLSKVHHCMADGISGTSLYRVMFDESPEPADPVADTWRAQPGPGTARLMLDALGDLIRSPVEQVRLVARGLAAPKALARQVRDTVWGLTALAGVLVPVPGSALSGPIGQPRRYGFARASLPEVAATAKVFGVTVNDVVLAAIAGAYRTLLREAGERPGDQGVRTLVPVSVRAPGEEGVIANRVSLMLALLPVEVADPVRRLAEVHRRLTALKASKEAEAGAAMTELAAHEPFAPVSLGMRVAAHLPQRSIVTVATNVPGPRRPLYVLGRQIVEILPYVPIAVRLRSGVSILTYAGRMSFGVTCDYARGPDAGVLARAIGDAVRELVEAGERSCSTLR